MRGFIREKDHSNATHAQRRSINRVTGQIMNSGSMALNYLLKLPADQVNLSPRLLHPHLHRRHLQNLETHQGLDNVRKISCTTSTTVELKTTITIVYINLHRRPFVTSHLAHCQQYFFYPHITINNFSLYFSSLYKFTIHFGTSISLVFNFDCTLIISICGIFYPKIFGYVLA
jgi:hypothetical protein